MHDRPEKRASQVVLLNCSALLLGLLLAGPVGATAVWQGEAPGGFQVPLVSHFMRFLANPNVAYLLLVMGLLGIMAELVTPGAILPGVFGVIFVVLALVGLGQLPTNWGGVVLIVAAIVMFLLDLHVAGFALSVGGVIAFVVGSLLMFGPFWSGSSAVPGAKLSPWLIAGTTVGVGAFFLLGLSAALKAQRAPVAVGQETIIGRLGVVQQPLTPAGIVRLESEEWSAVSVDDSSIEGGTRVRVVSTEGLVLKVAPVVDEGNPPAKPS